MTEYKFKQVQPSRSISPFAYVGISIPTADSKTKNAYISASLLEKLGWPGWVTIAYDEANEALLLSPRTEPDAESFKIGTARARDTEDAARAHGHRLVMWASLRAVISRPGRWIMTEEYGGGVVLRPENVTSVTGGVKRETEATI